MAFERVFSGARWEGKIGYCRALKAGHLIFVTGTAPVDEDGGIHSRGDPYAQTRQCLDLIEKALAGLGATMQDVVRTRMFVTDIARWEEFGRGHQEVFGEFPPTTSMVEVSSLIHPDMLIEIEADAVIE
jgi:enamine deaminase RidA (YjgF/YER057c/UK114 family)